MIREPIKPSWLNEPKDANSLTERIWPSTAKRDSDGEVVFGGVPVSDLIAQYGTPLYVVDQEEFERNARQVSEALSVAARFRRHGLLRRKSFSLNRGGSLD